MTSRKFLPLLLAAAATSNALGADPVYTEAVGFVKAGNVAADGGVTIDAVPAATDVWISVPLDKPVEFSGTVSSATANSISLNGTPDWATDVWRVESGSGAPYQVVVEPDELGTPNARSGMRAIIIGNSADTLTLMEPLLTTGTLADLQSGDRISIRPCWTISTLFTGAPIPSGTQLRLFNEMDSGINHISSATYRFTFNGTNWIAGNFSNGNDVVVTPGEGFILRAGASPVPALTFFGDVPTTPGRVDISKDSAGSIEDVELGPVSPVPISLAELNLPAQPGDQIQLIDNDAVGINKVSAAANRITFNSSGQWINGSFQNVTATQMISPSSGFRFRRAASSSDSSEWVQPQP